VCFCHLFAVHGATQGVLYGRCVAGYHLEPRAFAWLGRVLGGEGQRLSGISVCTGWGGGLLDGSPLVRNSLVCLCMAGAPWYLSGSNFDPPQFIADRAKRVGPPEHAFSLETIKAPTNLVDYVLPRAFAPTTPLCSTEWSVCGTGGVRVIFMACGPPLPPPPPKPHLLPPYPASGARPCAPAGVPLAHGGCAVVCTAPHARIWVVWVGYASGATIPDVIDVVRLPLPCTRVPPMAPQQHRADFLGIYFASTVYFMLYCAVTKNKPWVSKELCLPAWVSGIMWVSEGSSEGNARAWARLASAVGATTQTHFATPSATHMWRSPSVYAHAGLSSCGLQAIAQSSWFVANEKLSLPIAFPLVRWRLDTCLWELGLKAQCSLPPLFAPLHTPHRLGLTRSDVPVRHHSVHAQRCAQVCWCGCRCACCLAVGWLWAALRGVGVR
jgi:hypothetical protein